MSSVPRRLRHDVPSVLHFLGLSLASHMLSLIPTPSHTLAIWEPTASGSPALSPTGTGAARFPAPTACCTCPQGGGACPHMSPGARPPPCLSVLGSSPSLGMGTPSPLHRELPLALCPGPAPAHRTCYLGIPPGKPPQPHTLPQATPPSWPARLSPSSLLPKAEAWDCSSHPLPPAPHLPAPRETGPSTLPKEMLLPLTQTLR